MDGSCEGRCRAARRGHPTGLAEADRQAQELFITNSRSSVKDFPLAQWAWSAQS